MIARRTMLVALGLAVWTACARPSGGSAVPEDAARAVVSVTGLDCQSCGDKILAVLGEQPGVHAAEFDMTKAEVTVHYDQAVTTPTALVGAIERIGYGASPGAGAGAYLPALTFAGELDVREIASGGETGALEKNLVPGKVTVFDFHALWCGPCREVDKHMHAILQAHDDVALRKLDVVDWDSAVAKTHLRGVSSLPYLVVYDPKGKRVGTITGLKLDELDAMIDRARR